MKNIKRHDTELKWIKHLQSTFLLGFSDNLYHKDNISEVPHFDFFLFLSIRNVKVDLMVKEKTPSLSAKFVLKNAQILLRGVIRKFAENSCHFYVV